MVSAKNPGMVEAMICENVKNWSSVISYQTGFSEMQRKSLEKFREKNFEFSNTWDIKIFEMSILILCTKWNLIELTLMQ